MQRRLRCVFARRVLLLLRAHAAHVATARAALELLITPTPTLTLTPTPTLTLTLTLTQARAALEARRLEEAREAVALLTKARYLVITP